MKKEGKQQEIGASRRKFLAKVGGATSAIVAASAGLPSLLAGSYDAVAPKTRQKQQYALRGSDDLVWKTLRLPTQVANADSSYADKGGVFTKCLVHDNYGRVDLVSSNPSYIDALTTGTQAAFEGIILGSGGRTLNDPQGGLRYQLEGGDEEDFTAPPAPALGTPEFAAEMIEMYWASLLRDVEFNNYASNATAIAAAAELDANPYYNGPRSSSGHVTTNELFRGGFGRTPNYFPQGNSTTSQAN